MTWIGGLCAVLLAGQATAADRVCQGKVSDWPGEMTVTLRVDEAGKLKSSFASLRMGGKEMQFPVVRVEYELPGPDKATLGEITYLSVGAMVSKEQAPKSKTAEITIRVDDVAWTRPWGMYAQQDWGLKGKDGADVVGFVGVVPFEARKSGLGTALETGQFVIVAVRGVEAKENFGTRQQAVARRDVLQPMADQAHAAALAKLPDYRTACEAVSG
eukprot:gene19606-19501_t